LFFSFSTKLKSKPFAHFAVLIMKLFLFVVVVALLGTSIEGIRWRRKNSDGEDIVRVIRVLRSPLNGFPHVFDVVAGQKNTDSGDVDGIRFIWTSNWVPRHVVHHYSKDENSAEFFAARWMLWKLVEYSEDDGTDGFNPATDTKVSQYYLWNREWTRLSYSQTTIDGAEYHSLCTSLNDTQPRPSITICVNIADRRVQRLRTDPNALKWSWEVSSYPYAGNNTRLALKVAFDSNYVVKDLSESDGGTGATDIDSSSESALTVAEEENGNRGIASWSTSIDVTGCTSNTGSIVRSVVYEKDVNIDLDTLPGLGDTDGLSISRDKRIVYFSFITSCQAQSISWDPEFGVEVTSGVSAVLPSLFLLAAFVILQFLM